MTRRFNFNAKAKTQARLRQDGLCACCGEDLNDGLEYAHHVIPDQSGDASRPAHSALSDVDNCVVLCTECHLHVHENGRFRYGAVAPASYFRYSHGNNNRLHQKWVEQMTRLLVLVFD